MNEEYLQRIAARVEALGPLLAERALVVRRPTATLLIIRIDLRFIDGSRFEGNEIWTSAGRKYRFHLQDGRGELVWRVDNAPHHPEVRTQPHHLHMAGGRVEGCEAMTLEDALLRLGARRAGQEGA